MADITLLRDLVAIEAPKKEETKTEAGIVLLESSQEEPETGVVVAVGPGDYHGNEFVATTAKVGDTILFNKKNAGEPIDVDGTPMYIFSENVIIGILN